jgi:hypothetical protein
LRQAELNPVVKMIGRAVCADYARCQQEQICQHPYSVIDSRHIIRVAAHHLLIIYGEE